MAARHDPGFIRHARSKRAKRHVISTSLDDAQPLPLLLRQNVAEDAALFALVIVAPGTQFVENAARHKRGRGQLRSGVIKLLSRSRAMVLENADVLKAAVPLQVLYARRGQTQKLLHLGVAPIPQMAVVARILQQYLMRADRPPAVIETVAAPRRFAFDVIKRMRMDHRARRPRAAVQPRQCGDHLRGFGGGTAKPASLRSRSGIDDIVTGNHPRTGDGIFAEFHAVRRTKEFVICNW